MKINLGKSTQVERMSDVLNEAGLSLKMARSHVIVPGYHMQVVDPHGMWNTVHYKCTVIADSLMYAKHYRTRRWSK